MPAGVVAVVVVVGVCFVKLTVRTLAIGVDVVAACVVVVVVVVVVAAVVVVAWAGLNGCAPTDSGRD